LGADRVHHLAVDARRTKPHACNSSMSSAARLASASRDAANQGVPSGSAERSRPRLKVWARGRCGDTGSAACRHGQTADAGNRRFRCRPTWSAGCASRFLLDRERRRKSPQVSDIPVLTAKKNAGRKSTAIRNSALALGVEVSKASEDCRNREVGHTIQSIARLSEDRYSSGLWAGQPGFG